MILRSYVSNLRLSFIGLFLCAISTGSNNLESSFQLDDLNHSFFVSEIFNKYGNDNFMTFEGFEHLLENLGLGKLKFEKKHDVSIHKINGTFLEVHDKLSLHKHNHSTEQYKTELKINVSNTRKKRELTKYQGNGDVEDIRQKCLTAEDILTSFGLQSYHDVIISPSQYLLICPAIVYELDQKICQVEEIVEVVPKQDEYHLVWIYATASIIIMGISGMLCVFFVPVVQKKYFNNLVQFLVSLAVGTLAGDALIHLLPQLFTTKGKSASDLTSIMRGTVTLTAIFLFFLIENVLKVIQARRRQRQKPVKEAGKMLPIEEFEGHGHSHLHGHGHSHGFDEIKPLAWMVIMGDVLHNFTDGLSIGAAFSSSLSSGFASSIAIFCHELPHELGDYAVLLANGMSVKKSLFYNFVSSIFSFFGMVSGVLLGEIEEASLWINSFTAGSFLYIALSDLVPEMKIIDTKFASKNIITQMLGLGCGGILMFSIALYEDQIEDLLC